MKQVACFRLDQSFLAPQRLRDSGILFLGLGPEAARGTPEDGDNVYELFVKFVPLQWQYMGTYEFKRIDPLSQEAWLNNTDNQVSDVSQRFARILILTTLLCLIVPHKLCEDALQAQR